MDANSIDSKGPPHAIALADLAHAATQDGPVWSQSTEDLNANLVVLRSGHTIAEHINSEVDVLLVGIEGCGRITIDGVPGELCAGELLIVAKGSSRAIAPRDDRFAYVTCHKRRAGLWPTVEH